MNSNMTTAVVDYDGCWRTLINGQLTSGWWSTAERARQYVASVTQAPCEEVVATPELRVLLGREDEDRHESRRAAKAEAYRCRREEERQRLERRERRLQQPAERRRRAAREALLAERQAACAQLKISVNRWGLVYETQAARAIGCDRSVLRASCIHRVLKNRWGKSCRLYDPVTLVGALPLIRPTA